MNKPWFKSILAEIFVLLYKIGREAVNRRVIKIRKSAYFK